MATGYYFGFRTDDLGSVARTTAEVLGIKWELREADSRGGDYYRFLDGDRRSYWVQRNHAEFVSWVAPNYLRYGSILHVWWGDTTPAPDHADLLRQFEGIFPDVVFFQEADKGNLTPLKILQTEPLGIIFWIAALFSKLRSAR
jgi:hypothetical protein